MRSVQFIAFARPAGDNVGAPHCFDDGGDDDAGHTGQVDTHTRTALRQQPPVIRSG